MMRSGFWAISLAALALACGGKSDGDPGANPDGGAGLGGSGASAGSPGSGASSGSGGSAGTGATAGSGGVSGGGGGGVGGGPGLPPECTGDEECQLFSDCCTCAVLGPGDPTPPSCDAFCAIDKCASMGVTQPSCNAGQCTAFDCDGQVFCNALPPTCPVGMVPSVSGGCWGPCVNATECKSVPSCDVCTDPLTTCVKVETFAGDQGVSNHCVPIPKGCEGTPTCECMGSAVCTPPFALCSDLSGVKGMACSCPNC